MNKKFDRLIDIAFAHYPQHNLRCNHFTFALYGPKIMKIGINDPKTHTRNLQYNYFSRNNKDMRDQVGLHSEMDCVIKLGLSNCTHLTFINIRIDKNQQLNMAQPCRGCLSLFGQVGFKRIFFTNVRGEWSQL